MKSENEVSSQIATKAIFLNQNCEYAVEFFYLNRIFFLYVHRHKNIKINKILFKENIIHRGLQMSVMSDGA